MNNKFKVVISEEGQYSIWPEWKIIPHGWVQEGVEGSKEECLSYINQAWVDTRPKSLKEIS